MEYAKFVGPKVLQFFEKTFKVKYPLPKMDMIAIPDFSAGAMENWGNYSVDFRLITLRAFQSIFFMFGFSLSCQGIDLLF